jgi:hypothetical protein
MWLLFIRSHSTSARTSARFDHRAEPVGQIGAPAPKPVRVGWSTSNAPPPQKEHIQAQSPGHDKPERGNMTYSSLPGMHIQFRTLTFYSRSEEQLQERLCLKQIQGIELSFCTPSRKWYTNRFILWLYPDRYYGWVWSADQLQPPH